MRALVLALAILVAGCSTLATPRTFGDRLAYAHGSVTAALDTCTALYQRQRLTHAQGQRCLELSDQATAALALAKGAPDPQTAQGYLQIALGLLTQLEVMLAEAQR